MKSKLSTKYVRPTNRTFGHTKIFLDNTYIGYIIQDRNQFRAIGKNWCFCPTTDGFSIIHNKGKERYSNYITATSNRTKMIQEIKRYFNVE